jgi:NAD(P)-dependent dehydrogenase (short-subunit alcohol dehydrogenase family)
MAKKLAGKIALITGGSSGLGLATAKRFILEGAQVVVTGRRQTELDLAVAELGSSAVAVRGDVSNLSDLDNLYETIRKRYGRLDILFANAGGGAFVPLGDITEAHFDKYFGINVKGTLPRKAILRPSKIVTLSDSKLRR